MVARRSSSCGDRGRWSNIVKAVCCEAVAKRDNVGGGGKKRGDVIVVKIVEKGWKWVDRGRLTSSLLQGSRVLGMR